MPENGRFRREENLNVLGGLLERALADGTPASPVVAARLAQRWPRIVDGLLAAVNWRSATRRESLDRKLAQRREAERARVVANFEQFAASLRAALAEDDAEAEQALFSRVEASRSAEELQQYRRDRQSWAQRLAGLDAEREGELAAIDDRYREPVEHRFPVGVVFVVPRHIATA